MKKQKYPKHHKVRDRLPAQPLITMFNADMTDAQIARSLRISRSTIVDWRNRGIPFYEADRIACRVGVHPSHIWGNQWWQLTSAN